MSQNYQRGDLLKVQWFPIGFANMVLDIKGYDKSFESLVIDVTTTGSNGLRARLAGLRDFNVSVQAIFDLDNPTYAGIAPVIDGLSGILLTSVSTAGNKFFQLPSIIDKVHYVSALENALLYDFTLKANSRAGLLVFPTF